MTRSWIVNEPRVTSSSRTLELLHLRRQATIVGTDSLENSGYRQKCIPVTEPLCLPHVNACPTIYHLSRLETRDDVLLS